MTLPEIAIRRHVLAWMLNGVLVLFGVLSFLRIGVDRYPYIEFPMISVTTALPGADPEIIDKAVTNPIETAVNSVPGIEHIQSDSAPGVSVVRITFHLTKDVDAAFNEVQAKVNKVIRQLPEDAEVPVVEKVEFGAVPILWIVLKGDRTLKQLNQYARLHIKKRLEGIDGVGEVRLGGKRERTIRVNLETDRMAAYGIAAQDVIQAFESGHLQLPGGFLVEKDREYLIKLDLEFHKPDELQNLIVAYRDGAPIRLSDIATLEDGLEDARRLARYNGKPAVGLGIVKVTGANAVAVIEAVKARLEKEIIPNLPPGMELDIATDDSALILELVGALEEHLILGTILTALVVWLFLKSLRATAIIALAIPVSLLAAIAVMYFAGFTFNTMTLLALLLLIGVVVDDAIVVLENIYRHREEGLEPDMEGAALAGTRQVVFAVVAASLALVSIFASVFFMGGIIGRFFNAFAVVVTFGVLASLFVSLTLTPMLCARHLRVSATHGRLYWFLEAGLSALDAAYRWLLQKALRFRLGIVLIALALIYLSTFPLGKMGKGFLPEEDEGRFLITLRTPLGSSLAYTEGRLAVVEEVLRQTPDIAGFFSIIGGEGKQVNEGEIFVALTPREERERYMYRIIDDLRERLSHIPGIEAFPAPIPPMGGQRGEPLQFVLLGPDIRSVAKESFPLKERLDAIPELGRVDLDLKLTLPQLEITVDRVRARSLGISPRDVALAIHVLAGGLDVAKYDDAKGGGERYDVHLKAKEGSLRVPEDLKRLYLRSGQGNMVRLDTVARIDEGIGPSVVTRFDLRYSGNFYATPLIPEGDAAALVQKTASDLPAGFQLKMIGRAEEFAKTARYSIEALVIAILLVYMVLASQFDTFIQPLIIMVAQPLAIIGGVFGLWLMGMSLNIFSMIGLVLLMGLVAKNAILLVDLTNQFRRQGKGIDEALMLACPIRLRPVLMTSLTVIFTMLPAALGLGAGSDTNGPLAVAVIGGMASSTLLTLVVVPALYSLVENGLARLGKSD